MTEWDRLTEAQKATIAHETRRRHSSVVRETALAIAEARDDARADAFDEAVRFLAGSGFGDAAIALQQAAFGEQA